MNSHMHIYERSIMCMQDIEYLYLYVVIDDWMYSRKHEIMNLHGDYTKKEMASVHNRQEVPLISTHYHNQIHFIFD